MHLLHYQIRSSMIYWPLQAEWRSIKFNVSNEVEEASVCCTYILNPDCVKTKFTLNSSEQKKFTSKKRLTQNLHIFKFLSQRKS